MSCLLSSTVLAVEIITHALVNESILTTSQLRRIYTMRQHQWVDGSVITVFVLPSLHPIHQRFSKERLHIFPYQLDRIWNKLTYSGLGIAPIIVRSPKALVEAVIKTPGAVGYAESELVVEYKGGVHVIKIQG